VFVDGNRVSAINEEINAKGQIEWTKPATEDEFKPKIGQHSVGEHYFDREWRFLYVMLKGNNIVDIRTKETIFITFSMPMMTVDEFFGEQIIQNIAAFLDIPQNKIKVATAVSQTRRKRADVNQVTIEIVNLPSSTIDSSNPGDLTSAQLQEIAAKIINAYELGVLASVLELTILDLTLVTPPPGSDTNEWKIFAEIGTNGAFAAEIPTSLQLEVAPEIKTEQSAFTVQPSCRFLKADGSYVSSLGTLNSPWQITASLSHINTQYASEATVLGTTTVDFSDGWSNFTDLKISHSGTYKIIFAVTSPADASHFRVESAQFVVSAANIGAELTSVPSSVNVGDTFDVTMEMVDLTIREKLSDITWKGHTWTAEVSLYNSDSATLSCSSSCSVSVDTSTGSAQFTGLSINTYGHYHLAFRLVSSPNDFDQSTAVNTSITVYPQGYTAKEDTSIHHIKITFNGNFSSLNGYGYQFAVKVINYFWQKHSNIEFSNPTAYEGSIVVEFDAAGTEDDLDSAADSIYSEVESGLTLDFNSDSYSTTGDMWVDGEEYEGDEEDEDEKVPLAAIIVPCIAAALFLVVLEAFIVYYYKRKTGSMGSVTSLMNSEDDLRKKRPMQRRGTVFIDDMDYDQQYGVKSRTEDDGEVIQGQAPAPTLYNFNKLRPVSGYKPPGHLPPLNPRGDANITDTNDLRKQMDQ
jgi:hypothetical protein